MDSDPAVGPQLFLGGIVQSANSLWFRRKIHVVQESEQLLVRVQSSVNRFQRCVMTHTEEKGHEGVPLFSSLTLVDCVHPAVIVLPEICGWRRIKQTHKQENGTSSTLSKPWSIARRDMVSHALIPSIDVMVVSGSSSVSAWRT